MPSFLDPAIAALFRDQARARKAALDMAFANQAQQAAGLAGQMGRQYDALRNQTYTNARLSALGNNEALAAQGLAGAAYAGPQSGYSETSRVRQDTALGNAVNALGLQQQGAVNDIESQLSQGRMQRDANWLTAEADLQAQELAAQQQAYQVALAKAQAEVQMFGKVVTDEAAAVLGVKKGTAMRGMGSAAPKDSDDDPLKGYYEVDGKWWTAQELANAGYLYDKKTKGWNKKPPKPTPPNRSNYPDDRSFQTAVSYYNSQLAAYEAKYGK